MVEDLYNAADKVDGHKMNILRPHQMVHKVRKCRTSKEDQEISLLVHYGG